ncbi:glutamyl-tRNA amidotransferase [Rhodococcus sp. ADH]|uniref:amidase n=1 Tax=unclassified Rhodococcus (in: high G+C Gram-positive bacteria) TaxID=192944 RepID=UPI0006BA0FBB|nr:MULTISPECIES: amidase [unclassified Rhodococcus (in: high G+C Gram-positive bacteria)]KPH20536.1 glutamyl-tRNA amidotransferase [Rhodococcus sp. ADH]MCY4670720.1 amidase [Rhodococcus sp. (in: high G+C Gram-positive bacteria)]RGP48072.1 glutamyl-tRNA amidotransferase [Rhodococcus erythropolis]
MTNITLLPAAQLAQMIRSRDVSIVDVVHEHLDRIELVNPQINAYVTVVPESALADADRLQSELDAGHIRGPLHGVPLAIKDLFDFKAGVPNTFGVKELADFIPDETSEHVDSLERQGLVVLGKTNTPEFGHKGVTDNRLFGPTSTPFLSGMNAGGSSGGSASAVAAGIATLAQGSDGGGSVRIPAALSGAVGFKPTFGVIGDVIRPDAWFAFNPYMGNGPIARSVEDCTLLLNAMSGYVPRDPGSVPIECIDYSRSIFEPVSGIRVAFLPTLGGFPVQSDVASVTAEAVTALEQLGLHVDTPSFAIPGGHQEASDLWTRFISGALVAINSMFKDMGVDLQSTAWADMPPAFRSELERGLTMTVAQVRADQNLRTAIFDSFADVFENYDLIVSPTLAVSSIPNADDGWTVGPQVLSGETVDPTIGWCLTHPFNYTGSPAISVPAGFTPEGAPVGLQIVGRRYEDSKVLAVAAALERARPWSHRYSQLFSS